MSDHYVENLITETGLGTARWEFTWGSFTGANYVFPMFTGKDECGKPLRLVPELLVAPGQPMFAVMLYSDTDTYFSDTEEFPIEQGMDLWVAVENNCINKQFFLDEMDRRRAAAAVGRSYPDFEMPEQEMVDHDKVLHHIQEK